MHKTLISQDEAIQLLNAHAPEMIVLEVVSDYYNGSVSPKPQHPYPTVDFTQIKTEQVEIDSLWTLKSDQELQQVLATAGLTPNTQKHVLLFDTIHCTCGNVASRFDASARLLSILHYFGFTNVSIIFDVNARLGFYDRLSDQYHQTMQKLSPSALHNETQPSLTKLPTQTHWVPKHKNHFVNYDTLTEILSGKLGAYRLLDARSAEEFTGVVTGYNYVPLAGKIPTAENIINGEYQVSQDERLEAVLERLQAALTDKNINKDDRVIWYCGTAWRASRMWALTAAIGYTNVAIYGGGWNEWQKRHPEDASSAITQASSLKPD